MFIFFKKVITHTLTLLFLFNANLYGQSIGDKERIADSIWMQVEPQLEKASLDTTYQFIVDAVSRACKKNSALKAEVLGTFIVQLENKFYLPAATYLGEELILIARANGDLPLEANTRITLHRYYSALGRQKVATEHLEAAKKIFIKTQNDYEILRCEMYALLDSRSFRSTESVIEDMNTLLEQAKERDFTKGQFVLNHNLVQLYLEIGHVFDAEVNVAELEKIEQESGKSSTHTTLWRAQIEQEKGNLEKAEKHFVQALILSRIEPDPWIEVHILQAIAKIKLERNNFEAANLLLQESREKAENLNSFDLLAENYNVETQLAKAENRLEDAYNYLEKFYYYNELFHSKNKEFDLHSYYLNLEKEQLATEKEKTDLELALNKSQLKYSLAVTLFATILAGLLFFAFRRNRSRNKKLKQQNQLIKQQSFELQEMDVAKSRFFANVSHELRTPLTLLTSPIKTLLAENNLDPKQYKLLEIANQGGKHLEDLINEILDLKKLESSKLKLTLRPTEIATFFNNYIAQFESLAIQKEINYSYKNQLPSTIYANIDRKKWRQVLLNLISNAFKFTPKGGSIEVFTCLENNELVLKVSDTGEGIDPLDVPRIFDLYYQSESSTTNAAGGTGIGLALCHEYAQIFNGKLSVDSKLGEGSTFTFSIPFVGANSSEEPLGLATKPAKIQGHEPLINNRANHVTNRPTVLLVEDNTALQDYITLILTDTYNVQIASNGQEALDLLGSATFKIDLIVSDLMMPIMNGYALIEELKKEKQTSTIPVIMLTARNEMETRLMALRFGIDDYMTKPFDDRELLARITNLLQTRAVRLTPVDSDSMNEQPGFSEKEREWILRFENYIRENLSDSSLSVPKIASEFAMSESSLLRKTKRLIGLTPLQYIMDMRLDFAREILENKTHTSIKIIAVKAGYSETSTFSRNYKKRFGKLPSEY